jgi:hypothetical protein
MSATTQTMFRWLGELVDVDRRLHRRYPARGLVLVRPEAARGAARPARLLDISRGGACVALGCEYPVGAQLTLAPLGWAPDRLPRARVANVRPGDRFSILGLEFLTLLSAHELHEWHRHHCRGLTLGAGDASR